MHGRFTSPLKAHTYIIMQIAGGMLQAHEYLLTYPSLYHVLERIYPKLLYFMVLVESTIRFSVLSRSICDSDMPWRIVYYTICETWPRSLVPVSFFKRGTEHLSGDDSMSRPAHRHTNSKGNKVVTLATTW